MQKYSTLSDAIDLATYAHKNQLDKAGLPYINHPMRVLKSVQAQGVLPYVQIAAVMHDVCEDTAFTPQMLLDLGFPEASVRIVVLLSRNLCEPHEYYPRIREVPEAKIVKHADIDDNVQQWRLVYLPAETQVRLINKYTEARRQLDS